MIDPSATRRRSIGVVSPDEAELALPTAEIEQRYGAHYTVVGWSDADVALDAVRSLDGTGSELALHRYLAERAPTQ